MNIEDIRSIESEAGILATLVPHPEFIFYSEELKPRYFTDRDNQCIYAAIDALVKRDIYKIDAYNIIEVLNASDISKKMSEGITIEKLNEFIEMSDVIARHSIEEYKMLVLNVEKASFRRDVYRKLQECAQLCISPEVEDLENKIYSTIDKVMLDYSQTDDVPEFKDVIDGLWEEIEEHQDGRSASIPFKFQTLNKYVRLDPGELVVVAAPQKGAKSMFMLNETADILAMGKSVMYIDSELSSRLWLCRLISLLTGIEFERIKNGNYTGEEESNIRDAISWIKQQKLVHIYMPVLDKQNIFTAVKKVSHRFGKLDVFILDYLKSANGNTDAYATYSELGNLTDMVKNEIAGKMDIAALAATQLTDSGKIADSAKIARNASTIIKLTDKTQDEILEDGGKKSGNKKLRVTQNRNGMQHVDGEWININFNGNVCLLEEAVVQHVAETPY